MERLVLERGWIGFTIVCKLDIDFSVVVVRRQPCGNIRILLNKAGKYWFHLIKRFCCIHIYLYHTNLTKNDKLCQLQYFTLFILFVYFFLFVTSWRAVSTQGAIHASETNSWLLAIIPGSGCLGYALYWLPGCKSITSISLVVTSIDCLNFEKSLSWTCPLCFVSSFFWSIVTWGWLCGLWSQHCWESLVVRTQL